MNEFNKPPKWVLYVGIGLLVLALVMWMGSRSSGTMTEVADYTHMKRIDYSEVLEKVRTEPATIDKLVYVKGLREFPDKVIVSYKGGRSLVADIPGAYDYNTLASDAEKNHVGRQSLPMSGEDAAREYVQGPTKNGGDMFSSVPNILMMILGIAFPVIIIFMMWKGMRMQQNGGGANGFAKSKHKTFSPEKGVIKFADVAGIDEVKEAAERIVEFLKDPSEINSLGGKVAKCVLLVGPPGTGKTLLAKAIAGEAGVPAFYINASEFVEMFVGVGASRVRDMFEQIRKVLPAVLIIDELDAVAKQRGAGVGGGNDEREQTINQILTELDGFENNSGLIVFGLTNRPDVLDPAIKRSGRFGDKIMTVTLPDRTGRQQIIAVHAKDVKLDPKLRENNYLEISRRTAGFSGADIAAVLKTHAPDAAIERTRRLFGKGKKATMVTMEDIDVGISAIQMEGQAQGGKAKRVSMDVKRLLAYHELGHALVGELLHRMNNGWASLWGDPVQKVTIIGAGGAGGYTLMQGEEDPFCMTKEQLRGQITSLLAANRAEQMFLGTTSTGASNDIDRAYTLAKHMVTRYGMSNLGWLCVDKSSGSPFLGRDLAMGSGGYGLGQVSSNQIDHEIYLILADAALRADRCLLVLKGLMEEMAPKMIDEETFLRDRFVAIWEGYFGVTGTPVVDMAPLSREAIAESLPKLGLIAPEQPRT